MSFQCHIPGKLYLAGEYAVTQPYHAAIVFAVDRFISLHLEPCPKDQASIQSTGFQDQALGWKRRGDDFQLEKKQPALDFLVQLIRFVESYAKSCGCQLASYRLKISSQLDSSDGKKFGLGSSGAVSVGISRILSDFYQLQLTPLQIFKLATLAQLALGKNGSFGDLAASSFGGCLYYQCFDKPALQQLKENKSISELIDLPWKGLVIQSLSLHPDLQLEVGWTQEPASTDQLVDQMEQAEERATPFSEKEFWSASNRIVHDLVPALEENQFEKIKDLLADNRQWLKKLAHNRQMVIETPLLHKLIESSLHLGGAAKTSGAGGGDCGLALFNHLSPSQRQALHQEWEQAGILPLNLSIYQP